MVYRSDTLLLGPFKGKDFGWDPWSLDISDGISFAWRRA
jgi:hypothetical protein